MIYLLLGCLIVIIVLDIKLLRSYKSDVDGTMLAFVFLMGLVSLCTVCAYLSQSPEQSYKRCTEIIPDIADEYKENIRKIENLFNIFNIKEK